MKTNNGMFWFDVTRTVRNEKHKIKRPLGQRNCRRLIEGCGSVIGFTIIQMTTNQNDTTF